MTQHFLMTLPFIFNALGGPTVRWGGHSLYDADIIWSTTQMGGGRALGEDSSM